ncbi:XkdQ/YqbQ family protein [Pseudobacillus wudalianchiensis]|uniref:NlpC/P60 domain-containing protein n=1 Tax=Pseudobacillus wudalianchiensis TaxID=1743143 RepID=A0A1B9ATT6_9BACI|nr:NlpC/P60 family protein [Bacillus wudalianchiensis]OCA87287.1 hypothetical protein A8F95_08550 [Bacillus wudalianchiensis]
MATKIERVKEVYTEADRPKLRFYYFDKDYRYHISEMVTSHDFGGDIDAAAETFDITVHNRAKERRQIDFKCGRMVKVMIYKDGREAELYRGVIVTTQIDGEGRETIRTHDYNGYLAKNYLTHVFERQRADQVIAFLAKKAGVKTGKLVNTGYVFDNLTFIRKTLWEIVQTVLTETFLRTGKRYKVTDEKGFLTLKEVTLSADRKIIKRGENLLSSSREISIEETKTQVILSAGNELTGPKAVFTDHVAKAEYGLMTFADHDDEETSSSALQQKAKVLLKKLSVASDHITVEAMADYYVRAGTVIEVYDSLTGASDYYYVTAHSHTGNNGYGTMSLELSKVYEPEFVRYDDPTKDEGGGGAADLSKKLPNVSYTAGYVATAYAWKLGGINGNKQKNGITASGTTVREDRTIAVDPKLIPYGSIVAIYVPSMERYSGIYLAEDTGGAIKGKRIDIAVDPDQAMAFGRRDVQVAVLEQGKGKADARTKANNWNSVSAKWKKKFDALQEEEDKLDKRLGKVSDKREAVVRMALSYVGKLTYKWNGKNIPSGRGDCSGFSHHIFLKAAGVNIGHGTVSQITKGKKITKSAAQPGDLVFFKGTIKERGKNAVSHVGIVTRKGYCVSLASSGCKEHSYSNGYWGKHFMQINSLL